MNKYKFIDKFHLDRIINPICLILKHLWFFMLAVIRTFVENIIINAILIGLYIYANYSSNYDSTLVATLNGALISIFLTLNLLTSGIRYRKEIVWDGDIKIWAYEKYNFEHKKDTYYALCKNLSEIIHMICSYFNRLYSVNVVTSLNDFNSVAERYNLWRYEQKHFDLRHIDEINSYKIFDKYIKSFSNIEELISSIQCVQTHINTFCPHEYVKASIALLLNELLITRYNVIKLRKFVAESSVNHDANIWRDRLQNLYVYDTINSSIVENNIRNLVQNISVMYTDINKDYNFDKNKHK